MAFSTVTWASGEESSEAVGQWYPGHPDEMMGQCTSAITGDDSGNGQYPWKLTWCETPLPFVCQRKACLKGECTA